MKSVGYVWNQRVALTATRRIFTLDIIVAAAVACMEAITAAYWKLEKKSEPYGVRFSCLVDRISVRCSMILAVTGFFLIKFCYIYQGTGVENRRFPYEKHDSPKACDCSYLFSILVVYAVQRDCTNGLITACVFRI
jgi:hypothetical protein